MKSRKFEEVDSLIRSNDNRWADKAYVTSLRLKSLIVELFDLFLINCIKIIPVSYSKNPFASVTNEGPCILSLWHGSLFGALYFYRNKNVAVMASLSKDGDLITKILDSLGYQTIRGSSSRGGARVLLEAVKKLNRGTTVAFTIDGPKGPLRQIKPGIIKLAQKTGIPIIPLGMAFEKSIKLHSWDRLQIPLPFSKTFVNIGKPLIIDSNLSLEDGCSLLEKHMIESEKIAEENLKASR